MPDLYPTNRTQKRIHRETGKEFGIEVHHGLIEAKQHQREIKSEMMSLIEKLNGKNMSNEVMKRNLFDIYLKIK